MATMYEIMKSSDQRNTSITAFNKIMKSSDQRVNVMIYNYLGVLQNVLLEAISADNCIYGYKNVIILEE